MTEATVGMHSATCKGEQQQRKGSNGVVLHGGASASAIQQRFENISCKTICTLPGKLFMRCKCAPAFKNPLFFGKLRVAPDLARLR